MCLLCYVWRKNVFSFIFVEIVLCTTLFLSWKISSLNVDISRLNDKVDSYSTEIDALSQEVDSYASEIADLSIKLDSYSNIIYELGYNVIVLDSLIEKDNDILGKPNFYFSHEGKTLILPPPHLIKNFVIPTLFCHIFTAKNRILFLNQVEIFFL